MAEIGNHGLSTDRVDFYEVPGGLEIPLLAKRLAGTGRYAIIAAAGLIVDGGIYRHDFVAGAIIDAMMRIQLDSEVPIISAMLTPERFHDHPDHKRFFHDHFKVKGAGEPPPAPRPWQTWWRFRRLIPRRESRVAMC